MKPIVSLDSTQITRLILKFIELVSVKVHIPNRRLVVSLEEEKNSSATERLKKLDDARESLIEGLQAIDELKEEASRNKIEADNALQQILELQNSKASLEQELQHVQNLITADITTFRKVAGLSESDIQKERILGFISGVLASILASSLIGVSRWGFNTYIRSSKAEQELPKQQEPLLQQ